MTTEPDNSHEKTNPSMLQLIIDYLTNTSAVHLLVHVVYIGFICGFLSLSYVAAFHWSSIIQLYEDSNNHRQFNENLKTNAVADAKINEYLQKLMDSVDGMRAYVYRYHNGLPAISGVPFFFQTNVNEVISPGSTRLLNFEQRIPASIHIAMNTAFVANKCLLISDTRLNQNSQDYYFFESRNAVAVMRCPIYMDNGDLLGFVGIDWNRIQLGDSKITSALENVAKEISKIYETH